MPLRTEHRDAYLGWATECFRLATAGVSEGTQIHTHMCYAEFGDIIDAILALDADVVSIEAARSGMGVLEDLASADRLDRVDRTQRQAAPGGLRNVADGEPAPGTDLR